MSERIEGRKLGVAIVVLVALLAGSVYLGFDLAGGGNPAVTSPATVSVTAPLELPTNAEPSNQMPTPVTVPTTQLAPAPTATSEHSAAPPTTEAVIVDPTPVPRAQTDQAGQDGSLSSPSTGETSGQNDNNEGASVAASLSPQPESVSALEQLPVEIGCTSTEPIPASIDVSESIPPLTATTNPPEAADGLRYIWNFGNGYTIESPSTGYVSYDAAGSHEISILGIAPGGVIHRGTCATVDVTNGQVDLSVSCRVTPEDSRKTFDQAILTDPMKVIVSWVPDNQLLQLQFKFESFQQVEIVSNAPSGTSKTHQFVDAGARFDIAWHHAATDTRGTLSCPAFPS